MSIAVTRSEAMRRTETPNAVMTTLASPTQGPTAELSIWKVEMHSGQRGPLHVVDREQIWHVLAGAVEIAVAHESVRLDPGDAVVLAAGAERRITALTDVSLIVSGRSDACASVPGERRSRGTPPWMS